MNFVEEGISKDIGKQVDHSDSFRSSTLQPMNVLDNYDEISNSA